MNFGKYHKWGKIRWAKLSRISPDEVFHGKTFTVTQHLNNAIIRSLSNIHGKTFVVLLKTTKNAKV